MFCKNESIQNSIHSNFRKFDMKIAISLLNVDEILSEFHGSVQKCPNSLRNAEKWKKCEKIRQNSESSVNIFSFRMNNSILSLVTTLSPHDSKNPLRMQAGPVPAEYGEASISDKVLSQ